MVTLMLDSKLYLAPIPEDVQNVLDVGTGTGIWAMYVDHYRSNLASASLIMTSTVISPMSIQQRQLQAQICRPSNRLGYHQI